MLGCWWLLNAFDVLIGLPCDVWVGVFLSFLVCVLVVCQNILIPRIPLRADGHDFQQTRFQQEGSSGSPISFLVAGGEYSHSTRGLAHQGLQDHQTGCCKRLTGWLLSTHGSCFLNFWRIVCIDCWNRRTRTACSFDPHFHRRLDSCHPFHLSSGFLGWWISPKTWKHQSLLI